MFTLSPPTSAPLVTLTRPKDTLWIIELHNGEDSRLTSTLIDAGLKPALDEVERQWRTSWRASRKQKTGGEGALIIVGKRDQDKFFSNGFDFANIVNDSNFFPNVVNPLLVRLLKFPIPTIAALNGHTFAGAFMMSLACDYRVMTDGSTRRAWASMNEVHFGAPWPLSFAALVRAKVGDGRLHRQIALEGARFTPQEALQSGLVDHIVKGDTKDILAKAEAVADIVSKNAKMGVYGIIRMDMYRDTIQTIQVQPRTVNADIEDAAAKARL